MQGKGRIILRTAGNILYHHNHHHHPQYHSCRPLDYYCSTSRRSIHHLVPLHSVSSFICTNRINNQNNNNNNMKFRSSTLSVLALSIPATTTTAWAPLGQVRPALLVRGGRHALFSAVASSYTTEQIGESATESFRLQFKSEEGTSISPWHDIPLEGASGYNMVVEIPKMTKAKMEVATKEASNPIAQDIKKGKLRDYHGPIFWNYGCIPQTWENPLVKHPQLDCFGDNDPIDVVEIGSASLPMGSVKEVKPLGVLAMIDDGELDWKVLAIATDDPLAAEYNDIDDVPESIKAGVREWFRWYKTPDDKPVNSFGFDEKYLDVKAAKEVIEETHEAWKKLRSGETDAGKLWTGK